MMTGVQNLSLSKANTLATGNMDYVNSVYRAIRIFFQHFNPLLLPVALVGWFNLFDLGIVITSERQCC